LYSWPCSSFPACEREDVLTISIIIIFASQARRILDNIGNVFRVFVPLILYFVIIWTGVFGAMYYMTRKQGKDKWGYEMAVVQAFTAGSNK
jgi:ACR3 family arsenite transporter